MRAFALLGMMLVLTAGCVELYDFKVDNDHPGLVIEGQISDLSFNEYMEIPADGRYFSVKLSLTGNVTNERNRPVRDASVVLYDSNGKSWNYISSEVIPGLYLLYDKEFEAVPGTRYKLKIVLQDGDSYESAWEQLPDYSPGPMGDIHFEEVTRQQYVYKNRERVLDDVRGVEVKMELPPVIEGGPVFYQWDFDATWIYRATMTSSFSPVYRCWVSNPYYLSSYVMQTDHVGGYTQDLFFMPVEGNDRIFDRISILIGQYAMSEAYYNYWVDIQQQDERKGLFDPPPYNLISNLSASDPGIQVFGYFGVVHEQAKRWYFMRTDLEVPVENTWKEFCSNPLFDPPAKCFTCLAYDLGIPTNVRPWWWED